MELLRKYSAEGMLIFLCIYLLGAFTGPLLQKFGHPELGQKVTAIYRVFCHQRVERSMFILGQEGLIRFYSLDELEAKGVIPAENPYVPKALSTSIYGHPYVGNDQVGYKVALCIRDLAIYVALVAFGLIYILKYRISGKDLPYTFKWGLILALMLPMMLDGGFQLIAEIFDLSWVPDAYFASIWKRIITGGLFGVGFGMLIFPNLISSNNMLYNKQEDR